MSFNINNKLAFIDSFQFLSSLLDSLVKNLSKDNFKYLSQEFGSDVLDLVKQKGFYPYEYMSSFEKLKKDFQAKKSFIVRKKVIKLVIKSMSMHLKFGTHLK